MFANLERSLDPLPYILPSCLTASIACAGVNIFMTSAGGSLIELAELAIVSFTEGGSIDP